jgi:hypothetical protein
VAGDVLLPARLVGALQVRLDRGQQARLDEASAIELGFPHEALHRLGYTNT